MSKASDRLRKLADDMMAVDGDLLLTPGSIDPAEAADLLDEADNALVSVLASLVATTSLIARAEIERKEPSKVVASDAMFRQMMADYERAIGNARATLARIRGEQS